MTLSSSDGTVWESSSTAFKINVYEYKRKTNSITLGVPVVVLCPVWLLGLYTSLLVPLYFRCNGCNMEPIEGPRFHCQVCADFDFCQDCFDGGQAHNHAFERVDDHGQTAIYVGSPRSRKKALR